MRGERCDRERGVKDKMCEKGEVCERGRCVRGRDRGGKCDKREKGRCVSGREKGMCEIER